MADADKGKIVRLEQLSGFKGLSDTLLSKVAIITSLATVGALAQSISVITDDTWKVAYTDSENNILFGITQGGVWKLSTDVDEIMNNIINSFPTEDSTT